MTIQTVGYEIIIDDNCEATIDNDGKKITVKAKPMFNLNSGWYGGLYNQVPLNTLSPHANLPGHLRG